MPKFRPNSLPICGSLHLATREGFIDMLQEANEALTAGYDFVGFEKIDKWLGAVYRRRVPQSITAETERSVLVGD